MIERNPAELRDDLTRRAFLTNSVMGLGSLALTGLIGRDLAAGPDRMAAGASYPLHHRPTAKRVIMIFLSGGTSQLELFDHKPILEERHGEELPDSVRGGKRITGVTLKQGVLPVAGSVFKFKRYGESGMKLGELIPHVGEVCDDITLVRSVQTDHILHESAQTFLFTGTSLLHRPSFGSWVTYGLGSMNKDLPEFVVLLSGRSGSMPLHSRIWNNGFLPGRHQGVEFRSSGDPVLYVSNPPGIDADTRRKIVDGVRELNELEHAMVGDPSIQTRLHSYEMAARMQTSIPELMDLSGESKATLELYGAKPGKASYANNCLLARRLVERGVRFVQVCDRGWDHHYSIPRSLKRKCDETDRPTAALLKDLKRRGLLEDTLVLFAGEFGRTSYCEGPLTSTSYGRDHNNRVNSVWLAGGGVKKGHTYGQTDEWGWDVAEDPVHVHDLQATILHCLGMDHERLTYRYKGRDFRLTDVAGRVVPDLLA